MRFAVPFLSVVVEEVRDVRHRRHGDGLRIDEPCELKRCCLLGIRWGSFALGMIVWLKSYVWICPSIVCSLYSILSQESRIQSGLSVV